MSIVFKEYAVGAGLPGGLRFHDLRHTFASHLAMAGKSAKAIQKLMRHALPQSTDIYMRLSPEHLKEVSESLTYGSIPPPESHTEGAALPPRRLPPFLIPEKLSTKKPLSVVHGQGLTICF